MESDVITMQDLFTYRIDTVMPDRTVVGKLVPTGLRPTFDAKFRKHGLEIPAAYFDRGQAVEAIAQ
jgi:pilus assembly protein CpaF